MTYQVVLAVHVGAIVVAFGYPILAPLVVLGLRNDSSATRASVHRLSGRLIHVACIPAALVAFGAGAYLATDAELWDATWVVVPFVVLVFVIGATGAFIGPVETRLGRMAGRPEAAQTYRRLRRQLVIAFLVTDAAVLFALYVMVVKPWA